MLAALLSALLLAVACGDASAGTDSSIGVDGGGDANPPDAGAGVSPPQIPWLAEGVPPVAPPAWDCPVGWRSVEEADATTCEPFPAGGAETCADGEAHFPGAPGCDSLGAACPAGRFAEALPADAIHVDPAASPGGGGSAASPLSALADVPWATLSMGDTVALSKGTFSGSVAAGGGITVVGACAAETILTGPTSGATVAMSGSGAATVRDITIRDSPEGAVWVRGGQELTLEGVVIEGMSGQALLVQDGGAATLSRMVIRDGRAPAAGAFPRGVVAALGGRISLSNVVFERVLGIAMHAQNAGSTITAEDVVVRDTPTEPGTNAFGAAVVSTGGPTIEVRRALFEGSRSVAVLAIQPETSVTLETVIVRDMILPTRGSVMSNGIVADMGGRIVADAVLVERHFEYAAVASKEGSRLELSDAVFRGGRASRDDRSGRGFGAQLGGSITAERVLVMDYDGVGVYVADPGTSATIEDLVVRDPAPTGASGSGVQIVGGAAMTLARARVERVRGAGIHPILEGASLVAEDVAVRETLPFLESGLYGEAISVQQNARLSGTRILVERSRRLGINAFDAGSMLMLTDFVVRETLPQEIDGRTGQGVHVSGDAQAILSRGRIEDSHQVGMAAVGATIEATDLTVTGVQRDQCVDGVCATDGADAIGVLSSIGGVMTISRFSIERADVCGVMLALNASMDLSEGVVSDSAIGACVQVDDYALERITDGVAYRNNTTNLEATSLPVPGELDPSVSDEE